MNPSSPTDMASAVQTANIVLDHACYHEPQLRAVLQPLYCNLKDVGRDGVLTMEQSVAGFFTMAAAGVLGALEPSPHRVEALQALGHARAAVERAWATRGD